MNDQLDSIILWDKVNGFSNSFAEWDQVTDKHVSFVMTIAEPVLPKDYLRVISDYGRILREQGYPNTFLGRDWVSIGNQLSEILKISLSTTSKFNLRARGFNKESIKLISEYDFQNSLLIREVLIGVLRRKKDLQMILRI